jgi:hypothetical protein
VVANVLIGRRLRVGTAAEPVSESSARFDPLFVEGLDAVRQLVLETAPDGVAVQPDCPTLWHQFFRLQAPYLLLWSIVERYTALRFGPSLEPGERIEMLNGDATLTEAVVAAGAEGDMVVDARNPKSRLRLRPDGTGAARYYYQVRSNLSHRGKSAFQDARLVLKAVVELHDTMRVLLARSCPRWRRLGRSMTQPRYCSGLGCLPAQRRAGCRKKGPQSMMTGSWIRAIQTPFFTT